jgi:hypothetical protein
MLFYNISGRRGQHASLPACSGIDTIGEGSKAAQRISIQPGRRRRRIHPPVPLLH